MEAISKQPISGSLGTKMLELEPEIESEYERVLGTIGDADERLGEDCLTLREILNAHFLIANHFYLDGQGLGGIGPKDVGLLQSAISRQAAMFDGTEKWRGPYERCATLFFGLIKNHPFYDANKRTAFLSGLYQLYRLGRCPSADEQDFEDLTVDIADNALGKHSRYKDLVKNGEPDAEIKFISWYLRNNTRNIDRKHHSITYRELQSVLRGYDFSLANPHGNYIDVVRIDKKRRGLFGMLGREQTVEVRLGQIGFPRWSAQVGKAAIKTVREVTGLTHEKGVDSAAFFHGVHPMRALISTYHKPLMRLAQR
jgi:death-on-curing family protein